MFWPTGTDEMTAAAVHALASGEPPINFAAHQIRAGNISGAREDFEQMLAMLIAAIHPGARLIAANPGDWGIDVLAGELSGAVVIWQAKYFWPMVTKAKCNAIRSSFRSAVSSAAANGYQVRQWVLCVPSSMDAPTAQWWDNWRKRQQSETGVIIDVWHETTLRNLLISPDAADVRRHYYDPYAQPQPEPVRRPIHLPPEAATSRYDTALFLRQLRAAGHVEVDAAKRQFFNAELIAREVGYKGVPAELAALDEAGETAHGIWEARFNEARGKVPHDPLLPGLYREVMTDIRASTEQFPAQLRVGPVHCCGMMHRVVEHRRAGWVTHWRDVVAAHDAGSEAVRD